MPAQHSAKGSPAEPVDDLAFLALRAATQLSRSLKGKDADDRPVRALIAAIRQAPGIGSTLDRKHIAANPKALSVLTGALLDARKERMNTREILKKISIFVNGIDAADPRVQRIAQADLKDFCLALHSRLLAQRFPIKESDRIFTGGL